MEEVSGATKTLVADLDPEEVPVGNTYTIGNYHTVWNFQYFCITQILCEISFENCRSAKSASSTYLEALNYNFHEFLHFLKAKIYQINKVQGL